jgi:hypothetical protein
MTTKTANAFVFAAVYERAYAAGMAAANAAVPTPMVVYEAAGPTGNAAKPGGQSWVVPQGVCGFAWVTVRPGNSAFAKWLQKNGLAKPDSYAGGMKVWVSQFGQSMELKEAFANAMAKTFTEAGFTAYAGSRMD